jgi:hypothetical protein
VVVGEIAGDDRELEAGPPPGRVTYAAERVRVDVPHGLVEGMWAERFVRAPQPEERRPRAYELEPGGRHLVGQLGVGELGEEDERAAPVRPRRAGGDVAGGAHGEAGAGAANRHENPARIGEPDRLLERRAAERLRRGRRAPERRRGCHDRHYRCPSLHACLFPLSGESSLKET